MTEQRTKRLTLLAMCLGLFMAQLDTTVVNLALPSIGRDLGGDTAHLQWIVDAYNLVFASLLLTGGLLGDRLGRKPVFLAGLALFVAGSLLCGIAPTQGALVAARGLQGVGAALELPGTLAILAAAYPDPAERARAVAAWAGMAGLALAVGPTAGALMVDWLGWESIFLINVPIGIATWAMAARAVPPIGPDPNVGFDLPGQLGLALCLGTLTMAAIKSAAFGWGSPAVLGMLSLSVAGLAGFVLVERRSARPMVPLDLFRDRGLATAIPVAALMTFGMYGMLFTASLYLQAVRSASTLVAGLQLLPLSLAFIAVSQLAGRLQASTGPRWLLTAGMACMGVGLLALAVVGPATGYRILAIIFLVTGVGLGLNTGPVMATAIGRAPADKTGVASGLANTARMVGATLGVAVLGALLPSDSAGGGASGAFISGMRAAMTVGGLAILAGAALAAIGLRPPASNHARGAGRSRCCCGAAR